MEDIPRDLCLSSHLLGTSCRDSFLEIPPGMASVPGSLLIGTDGTVKLVQEELIYKKMTNHKIAGRELGDA